MPALKHGPRLLSTVRRGKFFLAQKSRRPVKPWDLQGMAGLGTAGRERARGGIEIRHAIDEDRPLAIEVASEIGPDVQAS